MTGVVEDDEMDELKQKGISLPYHRHQIFPSTSLFSLEKSWLFMGSKAEDAV